MESVKKNLSSILAMEITYYHKKGLSKGEAIYNLGVFLEEKHSLNLNVEHRKLLVEYHYQQLDKAVSMKQEWEKLGREMGWIG